MLSDSAIINLRRIIGVAVVLCVAICITISIFYKDKSVNINGYNIPIYVIMGIIGVASIVAGYYLSVIFRTSEEELKEYHNTLLENKLNKIRNIVNKDTHIPPVGSQYWSASINNIESTEKQLWSKYLRYIINIHKDDLKRLMTNTSYKGTSKQKKFINNYINAQEDIQDNFISSVRKSFNELRNKIDLEITQYEIDLKSDYSKNIKRSHSADRLLVAKLRKEHDKDKVAILVKEYNKFVELNNNLKLEVKNFKFPVTTPIENLDKEYIEVLGKDIQDYVNRYITDFMIAPIFR